MKHNLIRRSTSYPNQYRQGYRTPHIFILVAGMTLADKSSSEEDRIVHRIPRLTNGFKKSK